MKKINKWDSRYRQYDQLKLKYSQYMYYIFKNKTSMHVTDKPMPYIYFLISKVPCVE